jgi:uncharacterized membrane protein
MQTDQTKMHFQLAAALVASITFALVTTALAQQPSAKAQDWVAIFPAGRTYTGCLDSGRENGLDMPQITISADGSTALGCSLNGNMLTFHRWTQSGGDETLTEMDDAHHYPYPEVISPNGAVVALIRTTHARKDWHVFLWSKGSGLEDIAKVSRPRVNFVSDDGSVVVWTEENCHVFRWTHAGGAKDLGGSAYCAAVSAVSADGSEIVGVSSFRWTQQDGWQKFPAMDVPLGISPDGAVIVGTKGDHVIRWTLAGGAQDLGTLRTDGKSVAHSLNASAERAEIVGRLEIPAHDDVPAGSHAFLWTQSGGVQDLGDLGGKLSRLDSVSADGTVIVGSFVDTTGATVQFLSHPSDLVARRQAELKQQQAAKQAQEHALAAAQAEEDAKNAAIEADQQARYDKAMAKGRPAQIYSLAGDLQEEGRADLAANLYQALIDKYPDDPYTAKAIDKKEAAREAAAQQQQQAQDAANQSAANASTPQNVEACHQQCSATLTSCKSDAQNQHANAVAKGLVGLLSKNSASVSGAASDVQDADSASSACTEAYNSCSTACQ